MQPTTRLLQRTAVIPVFILALALVGVASTGTLMTTHSSAGAVTLKVTLNDKRIVLSHEGLRAGKTTLVLINQGHRQHALSINGPGMKREALRTVPAGKTATLTVTFREGAYLFADPALGASRAKWVTVTQAAAVAGGGRTVPPDSLTSTTGMNCDAE